RPGFEGGQNPLYLRLPKLGGFKNPFKKVYSIVNVDRLNVFEDKSVVTPETLISAGITRGNTLVKVLGRGEISKALTVKAHVFSKSAIEKIEKAKGKAEFISD
ncbi:MAG: 50S ribosomal protein L15, partial [Candidatus Subteraquimicrobiales bacterium]|nr:50S ribosomal protein L15 [Candidatus Subteraquimicrobiales bacterium]